MRLRVSKKFVLFCTVFTGGALSTVTLAQTAMNDAERARLIAEIEQHAAEQRA